MSTTGYPVRVEATLDPVLSRWLWLVKWFLAIPHYIVLAFLWLAFGVLTVIAFFAILFTGRYPRGVFDFNVGVLRWTWRVAYYTYGGLATDRYPPFTLHDDPSYPARLEVAFPQHLSRGLVLVKWWLLAIPHYLVVGLFLTSGWYIASDGNGDASPETWGGGLVGLLVLVAGVVLLFTGRYPRSVFDFVLGMDRWALRVAAYAGLMTDDYPPFRLDMGGHDPGSVDLAERGGPPPGTAPAGTVASGGAAPVGGTAPVGNPPPSTEPPLAGPGTTPPAPPTASGPPGGGASAQPPGTARTPGRWGAGRVLAVVLGAVLFLIGGALLTGGVTMGLADRALRDDAGFLMTDPTTVRSPGRAVVSPEFRLEAAGADLSNLIGDGRVKASAGFGRQVFVGIAAADDVTTFLDGMAYSTLTDAPTGSWPGGDPSYRFHPGGAAATAPADSSIWVASASGMGQQVVTWPVQEGSWRMVVMSPDARRGVVADVSFGAEVPALGWLWGGLTVSGVVLLLLSGLVLVLALRSRPSTAASPPAPTGGPEPSA
ncbi:DUF4389 domain-containing protein [Nocardioides mesophilus]|uniref:DUF4389 domain-containing protein n=1 Tax=Nocardioides mesophilus TaxID=433659 RepID=UPI001CB73B6A|nr:DUF4389 domain-containing protein [Nocardioides mesophilus]